MSKPTLGFIGTGKVGCTLARLWFEAGYEISAVYNRHSESAEELASLIRAEVANTPYQVIAQSDITFLTVSDDAISPVAESLAEGDLSGRALVHTSGASDITKLASLSAKGAMVGSLHPAFPFADVESSMRLLKGAAFAIESSHESLKQWLSDLVTVIEGKIILIEPGHKALYHASMVSASNYAITLYAVAQSLLKGIGATDEAASHALNTVMQATLANLLEQGIPTALTGPLTRADVGTIKAHLEALQVNPLFHDTYIALARLSYPMLEARGVNTELIEQVLRQEKTHADDNS